MLSRLLLPWVPLPSPGAGNSPAFHPKEWQWGVAQVPSSGCTLNSRRKIWKSRYLSRTSDQLNQNPQGGTLLGLRSTGFTGTLKLGGKKCGSKTQFLCLSPHYLRQVTLLFSSPVLQLRNHQISVSQPKLYCELVKPVNVLPPIPEWVRKETQPGD